MYAPRNPGLIEKVSPRRAPSFDVYFPIDGETVTVVPGKHRYEVSAPPPPPTRSEGSAEPSSQRCDAPNRKTGAPPPCDF